MFDVTQELTTKTRRKSNTRSMNEDEHNAYTKPSNSYQSDQYSRCARSTSFYCRPTGLKYSTASNTAI